MDPGPIFSLGPDFDPINLIPDPALNCLRILRDPEPRQWFTLCVFGKD